MTQRWEAADGGRIVQTHIAPQNRTIERVLQNQVWRPQKVGLVWSVPVSSKKSQRMDKREGKRIMGGGVQKRFFGGGV